MFNAQFSGSLEVRQIFGVAGEVLAAYDLCYLKSDGRYWKTDADAAATMPGVVLCLGTMAAGAGAMFHRSGPITNAAWTWATLGGLLYADTTTAGGMTQTAPSGSGDIVQIVGIPLSATSIDFDPQLVTVELA
jgi:hypothetical protein